MSPRAKSGSGQSSLGGAGAAASSGQSAAVGAGFRVWVESSMRRVYPATPPPSEPAPRSAMLHLARGEYQSFQIVLRSEAGRELRDVRVDVGPLTGETEIAAEHVEWLLVGFVRVENLDYTPIAANVAAAEADGAEAPGWWPDPLLPVERFDVAPRFTQAIWVTVYAPPRTRSGRCAGAVTVTARGLAPVRVDVEAEVHDFALAPGAGHFPTAFGLLEDQLERVYGRVDRAMRLQWGDFVLRHRINPGSIYRTSTPVVADLEHWLERGMNTFNVIYNRKTRDTRGLDDGSREQMSQIGAFLKALGKSEHGERLFSMAHYYGFDEVTVDLLECLRAEFREVREQFGLPTFTTSHVPQSPRDLRKLNVDWLCPLTSWLKPDQVSRCRQAGFKIWTYVSLEPDPPYANVRFDCPLIESRLLMWQMYHQQVDGFLYWAFNAWRSEGNDAPIDVGRQAPLLDWNVTSVWRWSSGAVQSWLHGDGRLLYPGLDGPIGSIRLANMRDGLQDWEYLWLLSQRTGRAADGIEACEPVTQGWTQYTKDPAVLEAQRRLIARRILEA